MGWDGFVISDFIFGLRDAVKSVRAGLDIEMPFRQRRAMVLADAIDHGDLDVADVDRCVERIIATLLRFEHVFRYAPDPAIIGCPPHRALARQVASAATVMLRNDGALLPASPGDVSRLVVIGTLADVVNLGDGGSSDVKSTTAVTPLAGLRAAFADAEVRHARDLGVESDRQPTASADLVVVVVGYTKHDEGEYIDNTASGAFVEELFPPTDHPSLGLTATLDDTPTDAGHSTDRGSEDTDLVSDPPEESVGADTSGMASGGDRISLRLSVAHESLITAAAELSDRVVVVVQCGSAVMMPWAGSVPSILVGWYGGVEGGNGLADVITGLAEPRGRLPFVVPTDEAHLPHFDKDAIAARYDLFHGQWLLDRDGHEPQFPFGAGMGYTTFELRRAEWDGGDQQVTVEVANTGGRDGSTVVFVHAGLDGSAVERPRSRLVGFARVHAAAGATASVTIDLDWAALHIRRNGAWWTEPGRYRVEIGQHANDSAALRLSTERTERIERGLAPRRR